jgi:hypothetical protein
MSGSASGMKQCGPRSDDGCKRWLPLSAFWAPYRQPNGRAKYPPLCIECARAQARARRPEFENRITAEVVREMMYPDTSHMLPAKPVCEIVASPAMQARFGF